MKFSLSILLLVSFFSVISGSQHEKSKSRNSLRPFIVGGKPITIDQAPYQISLLFHGDHNCGGSIISDNWILTACHCIDYILCPHKWRIRAGSSFLHTGGKILKIRRIIIHPKCDLSNDAFDSALIELKHKLEFNQNIQPVKLPLENEELDVGTPVNITGWGYKTRFGELSDQLMSAEVALFDYNICKEIYAGYSIGPDVICAKAEGGGKDTCTGDSGGPLVHNETLFGITSWGIGCGSIKYPGIYSKVSYIRDWIKIVSGI